MSSSMTNARDNRQSVQFFDVDLFRNKLENFMRKQAEEHFEPVNNKKRKLSDRWSDEDKAEMELTEDYRDDLVYQFGKRPRGNSYYPIDDDEIDLEEVSPLALPSPVSVPDHSAWPYIDSRVAEADNTERIMAMRRQLSGYSEASASSSSHSPSSTTAAYADDDSWMSPCPPLSRASLSHASSYTSYSNSGPQTPINSDSHNAALDLNLADEQLMSDLKFSNASCELDLGAMAPHERNLLAALAPERYEKAALIKRAFRQSEKLLDQFAREQQQKSEEVQMHMNMSMDDGEYDQVFGELMHV